MPGRTVPPPPQPAEIRSWPDHGSLFADRSRAMEEPHLLGIAKAVSPYRRAVRLLTAVPVPATAGGAYR